MLSRCADQLSWPCPASRPAPDQVRGRLLCRASTTKFSNSKDMHGRDNPRRLCDSPGHDESASLRGGFRSLALVLAVGDEVVHHARVGERGGVAEGAEIVLGDL